MRIDHGSWVVLADGERYVILENKGEAFSLDLHVRAHAEDHNPPTREQGTDKPGRFDDAGVGKSAVANTDWHWLEKERFAKTLCDQLNAQALDNAFDKLLLVADPRTLGAMRPEFHKELKARLIGEIPKDLTAQPIGEIETILAAA